MVVCKHCDEDREKLHIHFIDYRQTLLISFKAMKVESYSKYRTDQFGLLNLISIEKLVLLQPEVVELHLRMTAPQQQIQMSLLDLISATVQVTTEILQEKHLKKLFKAKQYIYYWLSPELTSSRQFPRLSTSRFPVYSLTFSRTLRF